jgi:hypothetical protein
VHPQCFWNIGTNEGAPIIVMPARNLTSTRGKARACLARSRQLILANPMVFTFAPGRHNTGRKLIFVLLLAESLLVQKLVGHPSSSLGTRCRRAKSLPLPTPYYSNLRTNFDQRPNCYKMALPSSDTRRQTVRVHAITIASSMTSCKSVQASSSTLEDF